jgi:PII-like signaling protein
MPFTGRGKQLTIFISETDQYHHQALYMAIIEMVRREGCSGATAVRGIAGFGASSLIHTAAVLRLSMDLPIIIIVLDRPERSIASSARSAKWLRARLSRCKTWKLFSREHPSGKACPTRRFRR